MEGKGVREITTKRTRHLYALKNAEMNGGLNEYLIEARKQGTPFTKIAAALSQSGTAVAKTTVFEWTHEITTAN